MLLPFTETGTEPVRWGVWDDFIDPSAMAMPPAGWTGWEAAYSNDCESGKRTARDLSAYGGLSHLLKTLRESADLWSEWLGYEVEDDPTLHGAGLHQTAPGGWLNTHLDYDLSPTVTGRRRCLNIITFLHPQWEAGWGGEFYLANPMGMPLWTFEPKPGRLLAFEVNDLSYHGVLPVAGPHNRTSLAVYFLCPATAANTRQRALFCPLRKPRPPANCAALKA